MSEDLVNLLNDGFKDKLTGDLENYLSTHSEEFKGPKGDEGPQGEQGPQRVTRRTRSTRKRWIYYFLYRYRLAVTFIN